MNRVIATLLSILLALFLTGCGAKNYNITTKTGQNFTCKGAPDYNVKSKTYTFKDAEGKEVILNQSDVEVIKESE